MKAILEFNLPEDQEQYSTCWNASDMKLALWDIGNLLRNKTKYAELSPEEDKVWNEVRDEFYKILNEYSLEIY